MSIRYVDTESLRYSIRSACIDAIYGIRYNREYAQNVADLTCHMCKVVMDNLKISESAKPQKPVVVYANDVRLIPVADAMNRYGMSRPRMIKFARAANALVRMGKNGTWVDVSKLDSRIEELEDCQVDENPSVVAVDVDGFNMQWTPCDVRMPHGGSEYLVTVISPMYGRRVIQCDYDELDFDSPFISVDGKSRNGYARSKTIAWMPCPIPYLEEEGEA